MVISAASACYKLCYTSANLINLNMSLNVKKMLCMRFGPRFNAISVSLTTLGGDLLAWVGICRSLDVYFSSAGTFKCRPLHNCKASFYRSFNAIYGHLRRCPSPEVILNLSSSKIYTSLAVRSRLLPYTCH